MRASDIREMSVDELKSRVTELERESFNLNFRSATQPLDNALQLRFIRRDIARIKTILRERTLESAR